MRHLTLILLTFFSSFVLRANDGSSSIFVNLQKLHSLKRVLYVAAHPDDENTRALAYFSLGEKAETAYFSLTRGDGGQNLIGDELSEELGLLRTQELLAARSFDGAKQYFSRALDFGYSKSAEESFELWGKDELMHDLVQMIRQFQPDVIITRFPPDERAGHGHHTASALLAIEAFHKAADENFLPAQVKKYGAWKTTSIYWNTSTWWSDEIKVLAKDNPDYLTLDIGGYNSELGMSYNEIGTLARSQHKCQGFGAIVERGSRIEYFKHLAGEKLTGSFFEKSDRTWSDILNTKFEKKFNNLIAEFNFRDPAENVDELLSILRDLESLPESFFRDEKIERCKKIILDCLGLHAELLGGDYAFTNLEETELKAALINRSDLEIILKSITLNTGETFENETELEKDLVIESLVQSSGNVPVYNPYWLEKPFTNLFDVKDSSNFCQPESQPSLTAKINILIDGEPFSFVVPAIYKWRDPSYGERSRQMIATPSITANFEDELILMKPNERRNVKIRLHAFQDDLTEQLTISLPKGWKSSPATFDVHFDKKHSEKWVSFELEPQSNAQEGEISVLLNGAPLKSYTEIAYDHIPTQAVFKTASIPCTQLDVKIKAGKVAYIKGVEDAVPQAIALLGFEVETFEVSDLSSLDLSNYQSVVLGIRIYNVHPELKNFDDKLFQYVEDGGNLIMQYNTAWRSQTGSTYGPYPFELSRKRVTEEDAEVTFLVPEHNLLNKPNKITKDDFDGWVQERGLYFADNWDKAYQPLFSWADKGEDPVLGGLIVCEHGKGQFVYTGISFFRELPNGVIGAYKLFANLLSF